MPAEFAILTKISEEGKDIVAVAPSNFAAYALELLDERISGLYEDLEAGTKDSSRQVAAIRKIESIKPGLYKELQNLDYNAADFAIGLRTVLNTLYK